MNAGLCMKLFARCKAWVMSLTSSALGTESRKRPGLSSIWPPSKVDCHRSECHNAPVYLREDDPGDLHYRCSVCHGYAVLYGTVRDVNRVAYDRGQTIIHDRMGYFLTGDEDEIQFRLSVGND